MTNEEKNLQSAKEGYAAYAATTDGKNYRGEPMPEFDQLPVKQQTVWINAAAAIRLPEEYRAAKLRSALVTLVGTDKKEELEEMAAFARITVAPAADKAAMIDAISTFIEVLED